MIGDPASQIESKPGGSSKRNNIPWPLGVTAGCMTLCVVVLVFASVPDQTALDLAVVAAVVPAIVYSWLILRLDRYEAEPRRVIVGTFFWGAVGAILFSVIAELIFAGLLVTTIGPEATSALTLVVGAPLIEEFFKGIAILVLLWRFRDEFDNVLDGLVYGALIGLGFAMTENILYFGAAYIEDGASGLGELFVARSIVDGFGHAAYTATFGAAVGWARTRYDQRRGIVAIPLLAFVLAVVQHMLWNGGALLLSGVQGEDATVFSVVLIEAPLFLLPALVVLFLIARAASRRERDILRQELADEVDHGVLTPAEYELLITDDLRQATLLQAKEQGGKPLVQRVRRFYQVAAELAFREHRLRRGERPRRGQDTPDEVYRTELALVREELAAVGLLEGAASPLALGAAPGGDPPSERQWSE
jgi:RsiW-degrading membrane proteinase PrsW (M82 family)